VGCSIEVHESFKLDDATWKAKTYPIAPEPVAGLEWVNCSTCDSTLARPIDGECS
jgi:hypothetical protein